ncbi:hypothetical protein EYF80_018162 [Liparis tanakae]|uniref:Uncharacterized protein n=1 Tax=Liparis tanakae TaxID=230148 RepID=A0A4Z2I103_9TELE|nr:hypothetical protein EYF80_018162 [Liparis tanakae]
MDMCSMQGVEVAGSLDGVEEEEEEEEEVEMGADESASTNLNDGRRSHRFDIFKRHNEAEVSDLEALACSYMITATETLQLHPPFFPSLSPGPDVGVSIPPSTGAHSFRAAEQTERAKKTAESREVGRVCAVAVLLPPSAGPSRVRHV